MDSYLLILDDLNRNGPQNVSAVPSPYNVNDTIVHKVQVLIRQIRRSKSMNARRDVLIYFWYLGELIENKVDPIKERPICIQNISPHYKKVAVRIFYLFELLGTEQIMRTQDITCTMIAKIKNDRYRALIQEAVVIAGARLLEEEVVSSGTVLDETSL